MAPTWFTYDQTGNTHTLPLRHPDFRLRQVLPRTKNIFQACSVQFPIFSLLQHSRHTLVLHTFKLQTISQTIQYCSIHIPAVLYLHSKIRLFQPHIKGQQQLIRSNVSSNKTAKKKKKRGQEKEDPYCKTQGMHTRGLHMVTLILPLLTSTFPKFF